MAMTWICVVGIELSARTQMGLLVTELAVLVLFSVVALAKAYSHTKGSISPVDVVAHTDRTSAASSALSDGLLAAVFIYWGWDTAASVNEECEDANTTPGPRQRAVDVHPRGDLRVFAFAAQSVRGADFLVEQLRRRAQRDAVTLVFGGPGSARSHSSC